MNILHLLKIEWLKVKKYKAFWTLLLLSLLFMFFWNYYVANSIAESKKNSFANNPMAKILPNPYELPNTYQMVSYSNSYFLIGLGILTILLLTNEFNYRTNRQNIIDGLTRTEFAVSKILIVVILAILAAAVNFITAVVVGKHISPASAATWENTQFAGYFFVQSLIYLTIALVISMLVKRSGLAIGLYFFLMLADTLTGLLLNKYVHPAGYFLPIDATDNLIPNPMRRFMVDDKRPEDKWMLGTSISYVIAFLILFIAYFKKADLK
jgi:hypothetical protein